MALVVCEACGKNVSDRAAVCPHCGAGLEKKLEQETSVILCEDCGAEIPEGVDACPNCGCPIKQTDNAPQQAKLPSIGTAKMKKILVLLGGFVVFAIILVVMGNIWNKPQLKEIPGYDDLFFGYSEEQVLDVIESSTTRTEPFKDIVFLIEESSDDKIGVSTSKTYIFYKKRLFGIQTTMVGNNVLSRYAIAVVYKTMYESVVEEIGEENITYKADRGNGDDVEGSYIYEKGNAKINEAITSDSNKTTMISSVFDSSVGEEVYNKYFS